MKPFNTLFSLNLETPTLFSISNTNTVLCNSYFKNIAEIKCLSDDKKCIDGQEKELLYEVEA